MGSLWNGLLDLIGSGLSLFYDVVPNFGVAIMLLTLVIGLILFPLTLKQTRSMKAMQEIQPEVKKLQKELKGDREQLNQELMALYKERGVNPAAGCLPMIVQLPIWFALFRVLRDPIQYLPDGAELGAALAGRGTEFEGSFDSTDFLAMNLQWSPNRVFAEADLITAIPYVILILAVVATGYYQTRQTMARQKPNGDQNQQQQTMQTVMKFFPIFFGVISWSLPAGLVLYFAVSQLFRIGQQAVILRMDPVKDGGDAPSADARPGRTGKAVDAPAPRSKRPAASDKPVAAKPVANRAQQGSKKKKRKRGKR